MYLFLYSYIEYAALCSLDFFFFKYQLVYKEKYMKLISWADDRLDLISSYLI